MLRRKIGQSKWTDSEGPWEGGGQFSIMLSGPISLKREHLVQQPGVIRKSLCKTGRALGEARARGEAGSRS